MKTLLFLISFSICYLADAQNIWTQKANYPDSVSGAVGFAINDKGYIGMGWNPGATKAFWEYDPSANQWLEKTSFPGPFLGHAVGFTIDDKGYIGTGLSGGVMLFQNDFWQYDPVGDSWTQKSNFGGKPRSEATGFSLNGKGYIGTGWNQNSGFIKDFWEYDPENDHWTQKADFPGSPRIGAIGFSLNGKGYIGLGHDSIGYKKDFWEYDPATDNWLQKSDFPSEPRGRAVAFVINYACFLGSGQGANGLLNDFWKYNPATDTWTQVADVGILPRHFSVGFTLDDKGYVGTGGNGGAPYYTDFWEYFPDGSSAVEDLFSIDVTVFPNPFSTQVTLLSNKNFKNATLTICNMNGKQETTVKNISGQTITFSCGDIPNGLYFLQIEQNNEILVTKKIEIINH